MSAHAVRVLKTTRVVLVLLRAIHMMTLMHQVPTMRASKQLKAAWDRKVGVPPGVRMDSKTGCSSHTGLATRKQRVGAHARAPLRSAVQPWAGEGM